MLGPTRQGTRMEQDSHNVVFLFIAETFAAISITQNYEAALLKIILMSESTFPHRYEPERT